MTGGCVVVLECHLARRIDSDLFPLQVREVVTDTEAGRPYPAAGPHRMECLVGSLHAVLFARREVVTDIGPFLSIGGTRQQKSQQKPVRHLHVQVPSFEDWTSRYGRQDCTKAATEGPPRTRAAIRPVHVPIKRLPRIVQRGLGSAQKRVPSFAGRRAIMRQLLTRRCLGLRLVIRPAGQGNGGLVVGVIGERIAHGPVKAARVRVVALRVDP